MHKYRLHPASGTCTGHFRRHITIHASSVQISPQNCENALADRLLNDMDIRGRTKESIDRHIKNSHVHASVKLDFWQVVLTPTRTLRAHVIPHACGQNVVGIASGVHMTSYGHI